MNVPRVEKPYCPILISVCRVFGSCQGIPSLVTEYIYLIVSMAHKFNETRNTMLHVSLHSYHSHLSENHGRNFFWMEFLGFSLRSHFNHRLISGARQVCGAYKTRKGKKKRSNLLHTPHKAKIYPCEQQIVISYFSSSQLRPLITLNGQNKSFPNASYVTRGRGGEKRVRVLVPSDDL